MSFIVHQALFGQSPSHGEGYEMLATSHPDKALVRRMGNSTDLGELPPSQLHWEPALRGRAWENFYLLFKTYADTSADVRPGRVFSHAFIIEQEHVAQIVNLSALLSLLPTTLIKTADIAPVEIELTSVQPPVLTPRLGYLLKELIRPTRSGPMVWVGQAGFEEAAAMLWQTLNAEERWKLTLNIGFMPNQLRDPENQLQLVVVPELMLDRWRSNFFIIAPEAAHTELSEAEAYAAGNKARAHNLTQFLRELGVPPREITDLDTLQRVAPTVAKLAHASLQEVIALVVALHWYYPGKSDLGKRVIERLIQLIQACNAEDLARLGSLTEKLLDLADLKRFGVEVSARLVKLSVKSPKPVLVEILIEWEDEPSRSWWRKSLQEAVHAIFSQWNSAAAQLVVELLGQPSSNVADYLAQLPATEQVEQALLSALPQKTGKTIWENGLKLARAHSWYSLHMVCALALVDLPQAIRQQLAIDKAPTHLSALRLAAKHKSEKDFVTTAVALNEPRLVELAGELCVAEPALLQKLNIEDDGWQAVWLASIHAGGALGAGTSQPETRVSSLLNWLLADGNVKEELLTLSSKSQYADLRSYPNRRAVWKVIPSQIRNSFLQATAMGLIEHSYPENPSEAIESELAAMLASPAVASKALASAEMTLDRATAYIERFNLSETALLDYLHSYRGNPQSKDTKLLGRLIGQKYWSNAAQKIFDLAWLKSSFKDGLEQCMHLLGPLDKVKAYFMLGLTGAASRHKLSDNWWDSLLTEVRKVYDEGPRQHSIWEESGGENHILKTGRSGGDQWADALKKMREHRVRNSIGHLLARLVYHHPGNEMFKILLQNLSYA